VIHLKPIGIIRTGYSDEYIKSSLLGVEGFVEVYPEYEGGLDGIEGFSHIILLAYLDRVAESERRVLRVRPRRLVRMGVDLQEVPEVGVFCTDSPHRPNPIALSIVRLIERSGRILRVDGLDLFNGTPILDIKPYTPDRIKPDHRLPDWYQKLEKRLMERIQLGEHPPL